MPEEIHLYAKRFMNHLCIFLGKILSMVMMILIFIIMTVAFTTQKMFHLEIPTLPLNYQTNMLALFQAVVIKFMLF